MDSTVKFWNKASKNYDISVYRKYKETYDETICLAKQHLKEDDKVLDYACGTGIITNELSGSVLSWHSTFFNLSKMRMLYWRE